MILIVYLLVSVALTAAYTQSQKRKTPNSGL